MMTKKMWEKVSQTEGLYHVDLSDETDREYYLERMGGKETFSRRYPGLYTAFQKGWERAEQGKDASTEVHAKFLDAVTTVPYRAEAGTGNQNEADLYYLGTRFDLHVLDRLHSPVSAQEPRKFQVDLSGQIFDPDSYGLSFITFYDCVGQMNQYSREYKGETLYHRKQFDNRNLIAYVEINVYDEENVLDPYIFTESVQFGIELPIQNIIFDAPHSNYNHNEIRILYGRDARNLSDPDYIYESNVPTGDQKMLRTIVPVKGSVKLKSSNGKGNYYSFNKLTEHPTGSIRHFCRSTLDYNGEVWKVFLREKGDEEVYAMLTDNENPRFTVEKKANHEDVLKFDLFNAKDPDCDNHYDWEDGFEKVSPTWIERTCYLTGGFEYDIDTVRASDNKVIMTKAYQIECKSVDPDQLAGRSYYTFEPGSQIIYIPPLRLWWGCHARDTQILMADGTKKRADEVEIGDRLPVYGERVLTVNNVYTGTEEELFHITADTGSTLKISVGHPLLQEDGTAVPAEMIQTGDAVLAGDGSVVHVTEVKKERYEDEVYNFSFEGEEGENYVIAEGLYSGDLYAQNKRAGKKKQMTEGQEALFAEMKRFREEAEKH